LLILSSEFLIFNEGIYHQFNIKNSSGNAPVERRVPRMDTGAEPKRTLRGTPALEPEFMENFPERSLHL
jgi:hypothetical protein